MSYKEVDKAQAGDQAGQKAMEDAVRSSAEAYASEVGAWTPGGENAAVSPEAIKEFGERKVKAFVEEQKDETDLG